MIAGFRPGRESIPAWDGRPGLWADDEVWTVTTPRPEDVHNELNAKAYRVVPLAFVEDVTVTREPYTGHPAAAADDYRRQLADRYGMSTDSLHPTGGRVHAGRLLLPPTTRATPAPWRSPGRARGSRGGSAPPSACAARRAVCGR
ncbi:hypothetical protein GCM10020000_87910 [Streptomyces olivoverticillatus]